MMIFHWKLKLKIKLEIIKSDKQDQGVIHSYNFLWEMIFSI